MPQPLRQPPPSSSIAARLLDAEAAARAIGPALLNDSARNEPIEKGTQSAPAQVCAVLVKREITLTPAADEALTQLVDVLRRATRTRLGTSLTARALLRAVAHCMGSIEREARRTGPCKLPANARGRDAERDRFEFRVAQAIANGMRSAACLESEEP